MNKASACIFIALLSVSLVASAQQLVIPGDHPDPSVVKIGDTYWATATSSNWAPVFPLLKSKDLVHWSLQGHVFVNPPSWADYYFWAPEITVDNGRVYVYYAAHKKDGNLCVGVASADKPEGPYKDHGPLVCEEAGSIDAFPIRDAQGKLFLIWKHDGNSVNQPTPIRMAEMNEERTKLVGAPVELFRNDQGWEANLVEGVSIMQANGYYYAFYSASSCCGSGCQYEQGVARARNIAGPWEKFENNPLRIDDNNWKCSGHGTPVRMGDQYFFLHHAYSVEGGIYNGRQGVLSLIQFTPDGWLRFADPVAEDVQVADVIDNFDNKQMSKFWEWSVFEKPRFKIKSGNLHLEAGTRASFLGVKTSVPDYNCVSLYEWNRSTASGGLGLIGDEKNYVALLASKDSLSVVRVREGKKEILQQIAAPSQKYIRLKMTVRSGKDIAFSYSGDIEGVQFQTIETGGLSADGLPPWDRGLRAGLLADGKGGTHASFRYFTMQNKANGQ